MVDALLSAAIIVIWSATALGARIARDVPDEVTPNRTRFALIADVLAIASVTIALAPRASPTLVALVAAFLLAYRFGLPARWSFAATSGFALGIGALEPALFAAIGVVLLVANLLRGACARTVRAAAIRDIVQPIGAGIVILMLSAL